VSVEELILHIGFHKTGTTAIQELCYRNREKLLNKIGIYYPDTYGFPGHYVYSFALNGYFPLWIPTELRKSENELLFDLKKEIENAKPKKILISAEDFIGIPFKLRKVVEFLNPNRIKILCYIRRQDRMIESLYNEYVKYIDPSNFFARFEYASYISLNYYNYMKNLVGLLKKTSNEIEISLRIYQKDFNKKWDIIEDFCDAIGIKKSAFTEEKVEANVSLSSTSTEALKRIKRKYLLPLETFDRVVGFLYKYDSQHPSRIKTLMSLEDRKKILDFYRESNEKLFREYFNQENLFVLSKEEEEFYKEQESIPKEEIEREIEKKYKNILEFIKNESFLPKTRIFTDQVFGSSELTQEFIRGGLISDWVGGHVDVCNEEKIAGWLLDLKDKEPYFLVKLNGIIVYVGKPSLERVDIKDLYGIDWNAGFTVFWKDVKLPEQILILPDDAEIEVEVVHEKTGYIIPGIYKKILKKDLVAKIKECEKPKAEIRKILTLDSEKLIYINLTVRKSASETVFIQTDITDILITYLPKNHDYNLICIVPKDTTSIPLVIKYLDGSEEIIEVKI
jgi:hypothetical protein